MKKMIILGAMVTLMLTGCGDAEANASAKATTNTFEELVSEADKIINEMTTEIEEESTENYLEGYDRYSSEYIAEKYYNTIDNVVSLREWRKFEKMGYSESKIMYCLLKYYGEIK